MAKFYSHSYIVFLVWPRCRLALNHFKESESSSQNLLLMMDIFVPFHSLKNTVESEILIILCNFAVRLMPLLGGGWIYETISFRAGILMQ